MKLPRSLTGVMVVLASLWLALLGAASDEVVGVTAFIAESHLEGGVNRRNLNFTTLTRPLIPRLAVRTR
jgi:hypothetical protein